MRGIRGAITADANTKEEIWQRTRELAAAMLAANNITPDAIGAAIFSATDDLTATFPATGARQLKNFDAVPLFDARQMSVENSLPMCIRALFLTDMDVPQREVKHIYLRGAKKLRPDLM